jgi:hypothetical protein
MKVLGLTVCSRIDSSLARFFCRQTLDLIFELLVKSLEKKRAKEEQENWNLFGGRKKRRTSLRRIFFVRLKHPRVKVRPSLSHTLMTTHKPWAEEQHRDRFSSKTSSSPS